MADIDELKDRVPEEKQPEENQESATNGSQPDEKAGAEPNYMAKQPQMVVKPTIWAGIAGLILGAFIALAAGVSIWGGIIGGAIGGGAIGLYLGETRKI